MEQVCLVNKSCIPCQGGMPSLDQVAVDKLVTELNSGWKINELGHLRKQYLLDNFMDSMVFANKIAEVSEKEAHHPNLTIAWGICVVEIWTHKINGLTESDFILAAKIEAIK
jgi:4a-hydroxytetrahydrobiopterin dehydratase